MPEQLYDLTIIGAGAGGLLAAGFAVQLGAKVALVEHHRIGGDCTWTGCVPSKALLKAAKVAHIVRSSAQYGINSPAPVTDMGRVCDYVSAAVQQIYAPTAPQALQQKGMDVYLGPTRFVDESTMVVGEQTVRSKHFLLVTGARPSIPRISGLDQVSYLTYEQIFVPCCFPTCNSVTYAFIDGETVTPLPRSVNVHEYLDYITNRVLPDFSHEIRGALEGLWSSSSVAGSAKSAADLALACESCGLPASLTVGDVAGHMIMLQDFMDPWTFNQKNLMKCCKEFLLPGGKQIPFCAYNTVGYREQARAQLEAMEPERIRARPDSSAMPS